MKKTIVTTVDKKKVEWICEYDDGSLDHPESVSDKGKLLIKALPGCGWSVTEEPNGLRLVVTAWIESKLTEMFGIHINPAEYHQFVSDDQHYKFLDICRNLRFEDLGLQPEFISSTVSEFLGLKLSPIIGALGRDHVQVRTVRPAKADFNPPHRDSYIGAYREVVNVWIPIICGEDATMPVIDGSHLWEEDLVERSGLGNAVVGGNKYNVPAIFGYKGRALSMTRPPVKLHEALVFSPYLVHGFGINSTNKTRFAIEFRLQIL